MIRIWSSTAILIYVRWFASADPAIAFPGAHPSMYAFTKVATHRNIYRIPVP